MKERSEYRDPAEFTISVEAFDALNGVHEFSGKYKRNKKSMLKKYRKRMCGSMKRGVVRRAAAAALFAVAVSGIVNAAAGGGFFERIWGSGGRQNIESHEETVFDEKKGISYTVTYPRREYTNEGLNRADTLIGSSVSYEPVVKKIGDTTLTVLLSVCDGNAAVAEFTLERKGGVDILQYGQLDNESKGARFSEHSPFRFGFADCHENIFIDLEKSTQDILYCYDYMVTDFQDEAIEGLTLEIYESCDTGETEYVKTESVSIPVQEELEKAEYVNEDGGVINISPISMKVDLNTGLGLSQEEAYDPWSVYYVAVNYEDETSYVVHEHGIEGVHSCSVETDNTGYVCGGLENNIVFVFNRLVDTGKVRSITVNETIYML